jgi:cyclohexyl-isocyanide hydratase
VTLLPRLAGRRATTRWASHDFLARLGAIPVRARVVAGGKFMTGGGITAGIDMGFRCIERGAVGG